MRAPWLAIGLFVSLALNLFLVGAAAGVIALGLRMARENGNPAAALVVATRNLPQPDRRDFRQMLAGERAVTMADARRSRDIRANAWGALADPTPDPAAVKARLAESRLIDVGVRQKVEERIVDYVAGLPPSDRALFAAGMRHALASRAAAGSPPAPSTENTASAANRAN